MYKELFHLKKTVFNAKHDISIKGFEVEVFVQDLNEKETVSHSNILYSCGWSPFEGETFIGKGTHTFVSGHLVYHHGKFDESVKGHRISFNR